MVPVKQTDVPFVTLRVKFRKVGTLQYISHLDLVRTMTKVVARARLPLWFTEGFNPKPKLVFSAPLSIGAESETEFMDIRLLERVEPAEAMAALNRNLTDEMRVSEAYYPTEKLSLLKWLSYEIRIHTLGASPDLALACEQTLTAPTVPVLKRTKSGDAVVDIRPLIHSLGVVCENGDLVVRAILNADPETFLNPEYLLTVLKEKHGILSCGDLMKEYVTILRTAAYRENMTAFH